MGAAAEPFAAMTEARVPAVINDPHSAWQGVLARSRHGSARAFPWSRVSDPTWETSPVDDNAAIVRFLKG